MEHSHYYLHSGGAQGADLAWEWIGKEVGIPLLVKHWRPEDLLFLPSDIRHQLEQAFLAAGKALGRPVKFSGSNLVKRNWLQVYHSQAVYAISTIISPGGLDKGFRNTSGKEVVAGGTGWAVEMAIQMGKPVYVFDQGREKWYEWYPSQNFFYPVEETVPPLPQSFAGIGSRNLTESGKKAIRDIYLKTLSVGNV